MRRRKKPAAARSVALGGPLPAVHAGRTSAQPKAEHDMSNPPAGLSFGALGVVPPGNGLVSGEPKGVDMRSALGNRAMGSLLERAVNGGLPPGVEGPQPLPKVNVARARPKPKDLSLEERFDRFVDPFLHQLLRRIKDEKRRALAVENVREAFKRAAQGWLEQGLADSELDDAEKAEIERAYEERRYEE